MVDAYVEERRGKEGAEVLSANRGPLLAALQAFVHSREPKVGGSEENEVLNFFYREG